MKPDLTDYDTINVIALKKAKIPIELCDESVRAAVEQGLPRFEIAEFFLLQLETAIKLNLIDFVLSNEDELFIEPIYLVHKDILNNWLTMDYPPIPEEVAKYLKEKEQTIEEPLSPKEKKPKNGKSINKQVSSKTLNCYKRLISAFCRLVERYETMPQPKPRHFKNRTIVKSTGNISKEALRNLLREIDPDTPSRAEEYIKASEEFLKEADDIISQALKEK